MASDLLSYLALFIASTGLRPAVFRSLVSFHLVSGRAFFLLPGMLVISTLFTVFFSSLLITGLRLFSRLSVLFSDACVTLVVPLMHSFLVLSFFVTPHIHLNILIPFASILSSCLLLVSRFLFRTTLLVGLLFPFQWHLPVEQHSTAFLAVSPTCTHPLFDLLSMPSFSSKTDPRLLKCVTFSSSPPNIFIVSLSISSFRSNLKSIKRVFGRLKLIPLSYNAFLHVSGNSHVYFLSTIQHCVICEHH